MAIELNKALGYCGDADVEYASDLTDLESDEKYACSSRTFERRAKRMYEMFVDSDGVVLEARKWNQIDEQLELLWAAIPDVCIVSTPGIFQLYY